MEVEREEVDNQRDDDQANDAEADVGDEGRLGHSEVAKLVPEILDRVKTDQSGAEHADPLDTADTANRQTAEHQPQKPLGRERLLLQSVEASPAENGGEGEEQKHRVEQDEAADGRVRVLKKNHEGDKPSRRLAEVQLLCSVVSQRNKQSSESTVELAHENVVDLFGISLARLEFE